ncbi:MAG: hypothetical protein LBQ44_10680 [Treponema sp.]|jgi:hypothetical protein|nr:hypothetical protein [Treponema sp.]
MKRNGRTPACFTVLPAILVFLSCATPPYSVNTARTVPEDFFGASPYKRGGVGPEDFELLDRQGVIWMRRDCSWNILEPEPGKWDFSSWDVYVDDSKAAGKKLIAILAYDAPWLNSEKSIAPEDLPHYLNYVEKVVTRYKGRIDAYEIWNEPNINRFWKRSDKDFFTLSGAAAQLIRRIDPGARILAGSLVRAPSGYARRLFKSGAMDYADALSFHPYAMNPGGSVRLYDKLAKLTAEFDFPGELWITEVGYPTGGWYPSMVLEKNFPRDIVKTLAGFAAREVRVLSWFEFKEDYNKGEAPSRLNSEYYFGLLHYDRSPKNGFEAYGLCARHLAGTEYRPDWPLRRNLPGRTVALGFKGPGGENTLIIWNEWGGAVPALLTLPGGEQCRWDISSGEGRPLGAVTEISIGKTPLFFTWKGDAPSLEPRRR